MSFINTIKSWFGTKTQPVPFSPSVDLALAQIKSKSSAGNKAQEAPRNKRRLTKPQLQAIESLPPKHSLELYDELNGGDVVGLKKAVYSRAWKWFGYNNFHLEVNREKNTVVIYRIS